MISDSSNYNGCFNCLSSFDEYGLNHKYFMNASRNSYDNDDYYWR